MQKIGSINVKIIGKIIKGKIIEKLILKGKIIEDLVAIVSSCNRNDS